MILVKFLAVALLISLTGFFVATEYAIVKVRRTRIKQLVDEGSSNARALLKIIDNLDEYLSACQLGVTITALGLGWLGESTIKAVLDPLVGALPLNQSITTILSVGVAFAFITFLNVVFGELAPKRIAIQKAEVIGLRLAKPLLMFKKVMYPFIVILNQSARIVSGMLGVKNTQGAEAALSEEELRIILSESYKSGEINQSEYQYVERIFNFDNRVAHEIMVPRTEMRTLTTNSTVPECLNYMKRERFSRYPVIEADKDHIIGVVHLKDLFYGIQKINIDELSLSQFTRPVITVLETISINELLLKMQSEQSHMAILVDEYGGTSGLVTVEDILEEIVGEIKDEFDEDEISDIQKKDEDFYIVDGKLLLEEISDILNVQIKDEDVDTIGGWLLKKKFNIEEGEEIIEGAFSFKVIEKENYHIKTVEVRKNTL
ncbi:hemolysin family protein [Bacillus carboniphilus]|uniref:Hemolysin family protein n=1 Tax=Bacillus carboniphilus TaxID=86663 RepID=A0ABY9JSK8_9BACI|nr:hemolysin family protein [Bacillus carboniphilus]WLR41238.1 hemolysin family protein [Bacillus carboniphilus]